MESASSSGGPNSDSARWSESEERVENEENMVIVDLAGRGLKKLESLPSSETHSTCTTLILDHNGLSRIDNLQEFKNLQQLSVGHNRLVRMNGVSRLPTIRVLNLPNNSIQTIEGLRELPHLEWLNLSGNSIKSIDHLSSNVKLRHLDLSDNSVSSITDISMLTTLKTLLLHGNILTTLRSVPSCFPKSLEILSLAENEISDLSEVSYLSSLTHLQQLSVMNNPCVLMATPCSSSANISPFNSGFDYRPYVVNWSPALHILDGYAVTHKESLKAEWLYSQGKGRWFHPGQHVQLVQYLSNTCPLTVVSETQAKEDERLMRILQQQKKYQKQGQDPSGMPTSDGQQGPPQHPASQQQQQQQKQPVQLPSPSPSPSQGHAQAQAHHALTPSSLPSTPVAAGSPVVMTPTRLSPTKLVPSLPLQKGNGHKSPTKRLPSPLRSPSPTKVLSPVAAWAGDRNENSQLHRNFKPSGEDSPPSVSSDVFLQDVEDNEVDHLGSLATEPSYLPLPKDVPQPKPAGTLSQPQQQQTYHASKQSKPSVVSKHGIADNANHLEIHPTRQPQNKSETTAFASHIRPHAESALNGVEASPVSKFQAYEDRPVKPLAANMLMKQLEASGSSGGGGGGGGGGGHSRGRKATTPTLKQSTSLPSTPTPKHSTSLPGTPTSRTPHDYHHTSKSSRDKGRGHQHKRVGGTSSHGDHPSPRSSSSSSNSSHQMKSEVKHIKEVANSRKQVKGQTPRHWEVNGNPDYESRPEAEQMPAQEAWAGKEDRKGGAATTIQAGWRGHHARKGEEKAGRAQKVMQEQRVEEHIQYLNMELDRTRQMYEQEKHLRELQMEALKLLWNQ
ncbi:uncharacterized protein, partial [Diadema antillarum]|uniref:uncharacterized protein n=1 Tax=Diadema antillarum TaxID=105358 RepID=UPI003A877039